MTEKTLTVVSHKNCTDGMMAAFWQYLWAKARGTLDTTQFLFCQYNTPIPEIEAKNVLVLDFSFTPTELENEAFRDKNISIHDHHKSSAQMYGGYGYSNRWCCKGTTTLFTEFVEELSGAELSYQHIYANTYTDGDAALGLGLPFHILKRLRRVSLCVQDRDLWKFGLAESRAIYELLNSVPSTFEAWEDLLINTPDDDFEEMVREMQIRVDMRTALSREYASLATTVNLENGKTAAVVNVASNFASEVGSHLSELHWFSAMFVISPKYGTVIVSLRSKAGDGADVSAIAKHYGGGGHANAAGFSIRYKEMPHALDALISGELFNNAIYAIEKEARLMQQLADNAIHLNR